MKIGLWTILFSASLALGCGGDGGDSKPVADSAADMAGPGDAGVDAGTSDSGPADMGVADMGFSDDWRRVPGAPGVEFYGIHASSADDVWVASSDGLWRFDGRGLTRAWEPGWLVTAIDSRSPTDVWAVGSKASNWRIAHYDGMSWTDFDYTQFLSGEGTLYDISVPSMPGAFYVTNGDNLFMYKQRAVLGDPAMSSIRTDDYLSRLYAEKSYKVWAVSANHLHTWQDGGSARSTNRVNIETGDGSLAGPINKGVHDLTWAMDRLWIGGGGFNNAVLIEFFGDRSVRHESEEFLGLQRISAAGDAIWWVDNMGRIGRFLNGQWERVPMAQIEARDIAVIHGPDGAVFALETDGLWVCRRAACEVFEPVAGSEPK